MATIVLSMVVWRAIKLLQYFWSNRECLVISLSMQTHGNDVESSRSRRRAFLMHAVYYHRSVNYKSWRVTRAINTHSSRNRETEKTAQNAILIQNRVYVVVERV